MYAEWDEELSLGIKEIDDQHQELFMKMNELRSTILLDRAKRRADVAGLIDFLEDYTVQHFGAEEQIMLQCSYPRYHEHKQAHLAFIGELAMFKLRLRSMESQGVAPSVLIADVERRMRNWFQEHIGNTDRQLTEFLSSGRK